MSPAAVVGDDEAVKYVLATGSLYGSPERVRDQVAELRDGGVQHLLCQDRLRRHEPRAESRLDAPLWRGGDAGIPNLRR
jgi:hypothetical protein